MTLQLGQGRNKSDANLMDISINVTKDHSEDVIRVRDIACSWEKKKERMGNDSVLDLLYVLILA